MSIERQPKIAKSTLAECLELRTQLKTIAEERDALRALTQVKLGVGSGSGNLFVYGDYESVKAAQAIILERDALRAERDDALKQVAQDAMAYGQRIVELEVEIDTLRNALERIAACPTTERSSCRAIAHDALFRKAE